MDTILFLLIAERTQLQVRLILIGFNFIVIILKCNISKGISSFNQSQTVSKTNKIGVTVPIEYYTYYIPFQYIFKQYPKELLKLSLTAPSSTVSQVSLQFATQTGKIELQIRNSFF